MEGIEIMSIENRVIGLVERFNQYNDWEDRYKELIKIGKNLDDLPVEFQIEKFQIKGCQSKVWLRPQYKNGVVEFFATSDAILVKGIVGLLVEAYSHATPDEIISYKDDFLKDIGITDHLSMNRTNGLASMLKQIKMYGIVFKSLADKGIKDANNF
ncbi:MAG: cysteine desulfuration protein SufE [Bacteriovoracaceae bacterium]